MDQFKIDNYLRENPKSIFPKFVPLNENNCLNLYKKLSAKTTLAQTATTADLVQEIQNLGTIVHIIEGTKDFQLESLLDKNGITVSEKLFVNWYRFDNIDEFYTKDFCLNFQDIWYPATDDIDIFDSNLEWIVSILHNGVVQILKL